MENPKKIKKIGSRQEVYYGLALRTSGGLTKVDIFEKVVNGKKYYVSKKLSAIAKERDMFSKYKPVRKTHKQSVNQLIKPKVSNNLTKKRITFNLQNNECKKIYYPELKGQNINRLRLENEEDEDEYEEEEEIVHTPKNFRIQDISEINL